MAASNPNIVTDRVFSSTNNKLLKTAAYVIGVQNQVGDLLA